MQKVGGRGALILAEPQNYVLQTHFFSVKDLTACIRPSFLDGGDGMYPSERGWFQIEPALLPKRMQVIRWTAGVSLWGGS